MQERESVRERKDEEEKECRRRRAKGGEFC